MPRLWFHQAQIRGIAKLQALAVACGEGAGSQTRSIVSGLYSYEFAHRAREQNRVREGIHFEAKPGEVIAIVGPSGSGKSTMMSLLQRFYDPTHGAVRLDGIDLRDIKQKFLRRNIGVVMQEALLFNESVRAGIAYGRPDATQAQIEAAAKAANAHDFILRLEKGYETVVGER